MRLLGLMGNKRAGKDTFAARLVERHGYRRFAFADPLKDMALDLNPIIEWGWMNDAGRPVRLSDVVKSNGWERAKDLYPEVRRTLQRLGTDVVRNHVGADFWLSKARESVERSITQGDGLIVFSDVRFPNEADLIRSQGGEIVRVVRVGQEPPGDHHPSEHALDDYAAAHTVRAASPVELRIAADRLA